jgi:HlyD family secretion protein
MWRKIVVWIGLGVIILLVVGIYIIYAKQAKTATAAATSEATMQTAVARIGDLAIMASGSGSIVAAVSFSVGFDESGSLIELRVGVGDKVKAGDLLARLQSTYSADEIAVSITDAKLAVIQAQQTLDDLYNNAEIARTTAINDIATYAQNVRDAQYTLDNYTIQTIFRGMDAIQAVDAMKTQLDAARAAFEPYRYYPAADENRYNLLVALNLAQSNYDAAVKWLNYQNALEVANANLTKARQEYEKYKSGPAADDLALAETGLANVQAKLAIAEKTQSIIELNAPISGTVMSVGASEGEVIGTSAIIVLADLEQPMLDVYLDESDLDLVAVGYPADVIFDALPDQTFTGKVVSVKPSLEAMSGVQAIHAVVALDMEGLDPNQAMPVGLSASVDIIAGRATNAVLVPLEALRQLGPGEYAVFVMVNSEPTLQVVEVGLMDVTSAEIKSGLQAGETVTTGIVQTQ